MQLFTEKLTARVVKEQTCMGCGCVFRYSVIKTAIGQGQRESVAATDARVRCHKMLGELQARPDRIVASHPCPSCGVVQPEMVLPTRAMHPIAAVLSACFLVFLGLGFFYMEDPPLTLLSMLGAGVFAVLALGQLSTGLTDPNANLAANVELGRREQEAGVLEVVTAGTPEDPPIRPTVRTPAHTVALVLVALGPLGFLHAFWQLHDQEDPPKNAQLDPPVVYPGDSCNYTIKGLPARAMNGDLWRGQPRVTVLNAAELGVSDRLEAVGSDASWDDVLPMSSRDQNLPLEPTIRIHLPEHPAVGGETLKLKIDMAVNYAYIASNDVFFGFRFGEGNLQVTRTIEIQVTDPVYSAWVRETSLIALGGGLAAVVGGAWLTLLSRQLQELVQPGKVLIPDDAPALS